MVNFCGAPRELLSTNFLCPHVNTCGVKVEKCGKFVNIVFFLYPTTKFLFISVLLKKKMTKVYKITK